MRSTCRNLIAVVLLTAAAGIAFAQETPQQPPPPLPVPEKQQQPAPKYSRGYYRLYVEHVMQADRGCDLDFLIGSSGSIVDRESH